MNTPAMCLIFARSISRPPGARPDGAGHTSRPRRRGRSVGTAARVAAHGHYDRYVRQSGKSQCEKASSQLQAVARTLALNLHVLHARPERDMGLASPLAI